MSIIDKLVFFISKNEEDDIYYRVKKMEKETLEIHAENKKEQAIDLDKSASFVEDNNEKQRLKKLSTLAKEQAVEMEKEANIREKYLQTIISSKNGG